MARRSKADRLTANALSAFQTVVDDLHEAARLRYEQADTLKAQAYQMLDASGDLYAAATQDRHRAERISDLID